MFAKEATWFLRTQVIDKQIKVNFDRIRPAIDGLKIGRWFQTKSNSLVVGSFLFRWHLIATRRQCADRLFFVGFYANWAKSYAWGRWFPLAWRTVFFWLQVSIRLLFFFLRFAAVWCVSSGATGDEWETLSRRRWNNKGNPVKTR